MMDGLRAILVVDDSLDWRMTIQGLLSDEGYQVQTAASSSRALELLQSGQFDLAILDLRLEETDESDAEGLELASEIRRLWPDVKIVLFSSHFTIEALKRATESDIEGYRLADDLLPKSNAPELAQVVQSVLARQFIAAPGIHTPSGEGHSQQEKGAATA